MKIEHTIKVKMTLNELRIIANILNSHVLTNGHMDTDAFKLIMETLEEYCD